MTTILKKIGKMLGGASSLVALAAVACLSVVMGCGGADTSGGTGQNVVFMDFAPATLGAGESVSTVGFTLVNKTQRNIVEIQYSDNTSSAVQTKVMNPRIPNNGTVAVFAKILLTTSSTSAGSSSSSGSTSGGTTITSPTSVITVVVVPDASLGNITVPVSITVDSTGKVTIAAASSGGIDVNSN